MLNTPLLQDGGGCFSVGGEQLQHASLVLHHDYCYHFLFSWPIKLSYLNPQTFTFSPHFPPQSHSHGKVKEKTAWC